MDWKKRRKSRKFEGQTYIYLKRDLRLFIKDIYFNNTKSKWMAQYKLENRDRLRNIRLNELTDDGSSFRPIGSVRTEK